GLLRRLGLGGLGGSRRGGLAPAGGTRGSRAPLATSARATLCRAARSGPLSRRRARGAANHSQQGFDLAPDRGVICTFNRARLHDGEVDVAAIDLDELDRGGRLLGPERGPVA